MRVTLPITGQTGSVFQHSAARLPLGQPRTHSHAELELNIVTAGSASLLIGNRWQLLRRGSLVWLFPGQEHLVMEQDPSFIMWVAVWRPELVARHAVGLGDARLAEDDPPGTWHRSLDGPLLRSLDATCRQMTGERIAAHAIVAGLEWLLCSAWTSTASLPLGDGGGELSAPVAQAVRLLQRPGAHDRLATLAARCGLSPARLSRCFHAEVGRTISAYRDQVRVQRAIDAWHAGAPSLLDAALGAGFGSYTRFYTVYRRLTGRSPRALLPGRDDMDGAAVVAKRSR